MFLSTYKKVVFSALFIAYLQSKFIKEIVEKVLHACFHSIVRIFTCDMAEDDACLRFDHSWLVVVLALMVDYGTLQDQYQQDPNVVLKKEHCALL